MPGKLLRWFILFAVTLAVPVQGIAAVGAGICMAMGHHVAAAAGAADHDHPEPGPHGHGASHEQGPAQPSGEAHCPPCTSCCAAAVISPAVLLPMPEGPPLGAVASLHPFVPGALPAGLDRPPLPL